MGFFGGMWEDFEWPAPRVKRTKINVAAARWRFVTLISHLVTRCAISLVTGSLGAFFVLLSCTRFSVKGVWAFGLMRSRDRQLGQSGPRKPMRRASQRGGQDHISATLKSGLGYFCPRTFINNWKWRPLGQWKFFRRVFRSGFGPFEVARSGGSDQIGKWNFHDSSAYLSATDALR